MQDAGTWLREGADSHGICADAFDKWAARAAELEAEVALYKQALRLSAIDELRLSQSYGDYDYLIDARCEYRLNQAREGAEHAPCN